MGDKSGHINHKNRVYLRQKKPGLSPPSKLKIALEISRAKATSPRRGNRQ